MKKRGTPFHGILYAGLMVHGEAFWVLEFNVRFGDPEAQVLLPRWSGDIYEAFVAAAQGRLGVAATAKAAATDRVKDIPFDPAPAVYVVGAARGYPENPERGAVIEGLSTSPDGTGSRGPVYYVAGVANSVANNAEKSAGETPSRATSANPAAWVTSGGRVLGALGRGDTVKAAREQAYARLSKIRFSGMQYRADIAEGLES